MRITTINISTSTIIRAIILILIVLFIFYVIDILFLLFAAFVIVSTISPLVDKLEKKKIPRILSTLVIYIIVFLGLGYLLSLIIPLLLTQLKQLVNEIPDYWNSLAENSFIKRVFNLKDSSGSYVSENFLKQLSLSNGIFTQAESFIKGVVYLALIFSLSFYMTIQKSALERFIRILTPKEHEQYVVGLIKRIQNKMGRWLQGQLLLNLIIGFSVYVALKSLGIPYALVLAIIAGTLEFVPNIGPVMATLLAAIIGFTVSPIKALLVVITFIIIQQLENHVVVPLVMKQAVGLNPVVIIISLLIGAKLGGAVGIIISVPFATALSEFLGDVLDKKTPMTSKS
ncbi:MAG: AI-2E family transporter [Candidatus Moranbacteria bacterium]|nr:AI-2E family transporter [Candidatus Moranbacteria bacterium]